MAKKNKEEKEEKVEVAKEQDSMKLSKLLIKEFNKDEDKTGKMAWCLATDEDNPTDVKEFISTGSTLLDYLIANKKGGGVPVGKLTEISGEEASGKSLICAHLIAECQKRGGLAIYIDTENAANPSFMQQIGVNISEMVYLQPGTIEEVGEAIEKTIIMARTRAPGKLILIIWDSVAGTPPQAEIEGNYDPNERIGLAAKALAKMMRKLTQVWGRERIAMVFTNQLRVKFGVMYGDPMGTTGGKAIPYHASVRVRLERGVNLKPAGKEDDPKSAVYGVHTRAKTVKSRLGPPLRKCEFDITFSSGIDDVNSWLEKLHQVGEIVRSGGWCYLPAVPSGNIEEKGVDKGKDCGIAFRESQWPDIIKNGVDVKRTSPDNEKKKIDVHVDVKPIVLDLLDKHMVVRYGEKPKDMVIDPESLMDAEAVTEAVINGEI